MVYGTGTVRDFPVPFSPLIPTHSETNPGIFSVESEVAGYRSHISFQKSMGIRTIFFVILALCVSRFNIEKKLVDTPRDVAGFQNNWAYCGPTLHIMYMENRKQKI
jgi:hypothetical protein